MPANLSPEYKAAEQAFRKAREPRERLDHLREMLRTIPKHKGTDHLQADIKRRIKELSEALEGPRKGAARGGPSLVVHPDGAAQLALVGPPNSGKSALHARLTGSGAHVAEYPFTTQTPEPGMMRWEDIQFQLVDLPAVSPEHPVPWLASALQTADACLLVVDFGHADCIEEVQAVHAILREKRVTLTGRWPGIDAPVAEEGDDPFALRLPALLVANKADLSADEGAELEAFRELTGLRYPALVVSATTGAGLDALGPWLFDALGIVRVYTKAPGKPPEKERPFTLRRGQTAEDAARLVHQDIAHALKYARVWGRSGRDGQHVGREHRLEDGDVVELHVWRPIALRLDRTKDTNPFTASSRYRDASGPPAMDHSGVDLVGTMFNGCACARPSFLATIEPMRELDPCMVLLVGPATFAWRAPPAGSTERIIALGGAVLYPYK